MCRTLLVVLFVWLIFSIIGVNLFAGKFESCFNETSKEFFLASEVENKSECLELSLNAAEVRWTTTSRFNFDNVMMGLLSLLIVVSDTFTHKNTETLIRFRNYTPNETKFDENL